MRITIIQLKAQLEQAEASISGLCATIDNMEKNHQLKLAKFIAKFTECAVSCFEHGEIDKGNEMLNAISYAQQNS